MSWLNKFLHKEAMKKEALDKLPPEDINGIVPGQNEAPGSNAPPGAVPPPPADPSAPGADPNAAPGAAPAPPGGDPNALAAMPLDPTQLPEKPVAYNNKFLVDANGIQFEVELTPSLVTEPDMPQGVPGMDQQQDPMQDKSTNPNADPDALTQWLNQPDKPVGHADMGTEDPLSKQQEGIDVHDLDDPLRKMQSSTPGKVTQASISKKSDAGIAPAVTPGADKSAPYYPCAVCANFIAAKNDCKQGLDVEKVQAAKSCSWLNSNLKPFNADKDVRDPSGPRDGENYNSDINSAPSMTPGSGKTASLKNIWE